jgi:hypothetical protein
MTVRRYEERVVYLVLELLVFILEPSDVIFKQIKLVLLLLSALLR